MQRFARPVAMLAEAETIFDVLLGRSFFVVAVFGRRPWTQLGWWLALITIFALT
jgi:hypothetical protein